MSQEITNDQADLELLSLATEDTGKFAIGVTMMLQPHLQMALERGQINDWFRLIDVSFISAAPSQLCRVFMLTDVGRYRLAKLQGRQT